MSYTATLYIPFENTSLTEQVNTVSPSKSSTPSIVSGVFGNAWQMDDQTKLTYSSITSLFTTTGTIGFWLKSVNPGMVTNPNTDATESLVMPLFSLCTFNVTANPVTASNIQFMVWEETQYDGTNVMKVRLGSASSCVYTSSPYQTGVWHYFWITINTSNSILMKVDFIVDSGSQQGTPLTTLPSGGVFEMNNAVSGYGHYAIARNGAIIDDLVIFPSVLSDTYMLQAARYGAAIAADSVVGATTQEVDQALILDDSSTAQINSIYSSRGNLYVARSDGKLQKGSKTLWESQRVFGNENDVNTLSFYTVKGATSLSFTSDGLEINSEVVRI